MTKRRPKYEDYSEFNKYFDLNIDSVIVSGLDNAEYFFSPSKLLYTLDQDAYEEQLTAYEEIKLNELKSSVIYSFPNPIAYSFRRVQRNALYEFQKPFFLKDAWESIINTLYAIAVSEFRDKSIPIKNSSRIQSGEVINFQHLFSDSLSKRLDIIEALRQIGKKEGIELDLLNIVPDGVTKKLKRLNQRRNGFSHSSSMNNREALDLYKKCLALIYEIFEDLSELKHVGFYQFLTSQNDICTLNCLSFCGYEMENTIEEVKISEELLIPLRRHTKKPGLILKYRASLYNLSPFIFFKETSQEDRTIPCIYRKTLRGKYLYDVVGRAALEDKDLFAISVKDFEEEVDELRTLCGLERS